MRGGKVAKLRLKRKEIKQRIHTRLENLHKNILQKTEGKEASAFLKYHKALHITLDNKCALLKKF